jgi:hypothetical protein
MEPIIKAAPSSDAVRGMFVPFPEVGCVKLDLRVQIRRRYLAANMDVNIQKWIARVPVLGNAAAPLADSRSIDGRGID